MTLTNPIPFAEALQRTDVRKVLPTHLSTAELQQLDADILRTSFFSARNSLTQWLNEAKDQVRRIVNPESAIRPAGDPRAGEAFTRGQDLATARVDLRDLIRSLGYAPSAEERGTITDLSSSGRIDLVLRTNIQIAQGYGYWLQGQDTAVLDEWPAQELFRAEDRKMERNWGPRWIAAARAAGDHDAIAVFGDTGRFVARKDSGIWQALGDGAGGFDQDALHNPYPPFAFQSGMDVRDVSRADAMELGIIDRDTVPVPQSQEFNRGLVENLDALELA